MESINLQMTWESKEALNFRFNFAWKIQRYIHRGLTPDSSISLLKPQFPHL